MVGGDGQSCRGSSRITGTGDRSAAATAREIESVAVGRAKSRAPPPPLLSVRGAES